MPSRSLNAHRFGSAQDYYRVQYLTLLECTVSHIVQRFEQCNMIMCIGLLQDGKSYENHASSTRFFSAAQ